MRVPVESRVSNSLRHSESLEILMRFSSAALKIISKLLLGAYIPVICLNTNWRI